MNKQLTAANEKAVTALVQNCRVKGQWQALAERFGKGRADAKIAKEQNVPVSTVQAARYYWN